MHTNSKARRIVTKLPRANNQEIEKRYGKHYMFVSRILEQIERLGITSIERLKCFIEKNPDPLSRLGIPEVNNEEEMWSYLSTWATLNFILDHFPTCLLFLKDQFPAVSSVPHEVKVYGFKGDQHFSTDPFSAVQLLHKEIITCWNEFQKNRNTFHAPFLHLFQSSGYGKSRTTVQLAKLIDEIFICCRPAEIETGEPTRSLLVVNYIEKLDHTTFSWGLLILTVLIIREHLPTRMNDEWLHFLFTDKDMQVEFWEMVIHLHANLLRLYGSVENRLSTVTNHDVEEIVVGRHLLTIYCRFHCNELNYETFIQKSCNLEGLSPNVNVAEDIDIPSTVDVPLLLFVLDEASLVLLPVIQGRERTDPLLAFRRALRAVSIHFKVFALTLDTSSKLLNYMTERKTDSSGRVAVRGHRLFEPFFLFPLQVNLVNPNDPKLRQGFTLYETVGEIEVEIKVIFNAAYLLQYSRALFSAHYKDSTCVGVSGFWGVELVIDIAKTKLLGLRSGKDWATLLTNHTSLFAVLASQFNLKTTNSPLKELLVYQHLATFNGFTTEDHDDIKSEYPSEPLVSEAAMQSIQLPEYFTASLDTLKRSVPDILSLSSGGKGEIGELIASVILLRCFTVASVMRLPAIKQITKVLSRPLPLIAFLQTLLQGHPKAPDFFHSFMQENDGKLFQRSLVQFNHYIKVDYDDFTADDLLFYFKRFAAICCPPGATGIDIIIPVAIPTDADHAIDLENKDTFRMSAVSIQVKNTTSSLNINNLVDQFMKNPLAKSIGFKQGSPEQIFLVMNINAGSLTGIFRRSVKITVKEETIEPTEPQISQEIVEDIHLDVVEATHEDPFWKLHCWFDEGGKMVPETTRKLRSAKEIEKKNKFFVLQLCDTFAYPAFLNQEQKNILLSIRDYNYEEKEIIQRLERLKIDKKDIEIIMENRNPGRKKSLSSLEGQLKSEGKESAST